MKKIISFLLSFIIIVSVFPFSVLAEEKSMPDLALSADCAILCEQNSGEVLYEKDADKQVPIASVTKVMTLLLVVEAIDDKVISLEDEVVVSENSASMGGSQMFLEVGEKIKVNDLLKAVFVASANDGAVALAEFVAGSESAFVERMNSRAKELGMENTVFYNPTGLDDSETNLLSARDVMKMSNELLKHDIIYQYTKIWTDSVRNGAFGLANTNKLIRFYPGATGLKTGSTGKAKFCLSASAEKNGLKLCGVVLGAPSSKERFADAKALLDYGFANYAYFVPEDFKDCEIKVWGGKAGAVSVGSDLCGMLLEKKNAVGITTRVEIAESLSAPVEKGQSVGEVIFEKNGEAIKKVPILTKEAVEKKSVFDIFKTLLRLFFLKSE